MWMDQQRDRTPEIVNPVKGHDGWWDLKQLMDAMVHAVDIFEFTHPGKVGVWLFDCSLAHVGLTPDTLNVNNINTKLGGKHK